MLRYCLTFLATATTLIVGICLCAYLGMVEGYLSPVEIASLRARLQAIEDAAPPDVLLVGDSSLSHAISSDTFLELTGRRALNLGLPGIFGYGGSLNMIRRARQRFDVRTIVIMHTLEMASRPPAGLGSALTEPAPSLADRIEIVGDALGIRNLIKIARALAVRGKSGRRFVDGFPVQSRTTFDDPVFVASPQSVRADKVAELAELAEYCRAEGLKCIYAHGPYWDQSCAADQAYIEAVGRAVLATGLQLATPQPLCFAKSQLGNEPDHIRPDLKSWTTALFVARLRPWLRRP
jgi:hypothetical protein